MKEKTIEFDSVRDMSQSDVFDLKHENKSVEAIQTHYDKIKEKYICKIKYGKR